jgi:hypothetical protein
LALGWVRVGVRRVGVGVKLGLGLKVKEQDMKIESCFEFGVGIIIDG